MNLKTIQQMFLGISVLSKSNEPITMLEHDAAVAYAMDKAMSHLEKHMLKQGEIGKAMIQVITRIREETDGILKKEFGIED